MFILPTGSSKPVCLICSETGDYQKRQCEAPPRDEAQIFRANIPTQIRTEGTEHKRSKSPIWSIYQNLNTSFTAQQRFNECFLRVAWILGQHKKQNI